MIQLILITIAYATGFFIGQKVERKFLCQKHEIRAEYDKCMKEGAK